LNLIYLVCAMALVTYIPRMLPMVLLQNVKLPVYVKQFMKLIPMQRWAHLFFLVYLVQQGPITWNRQLLDVVWLSIGLERDESYYCSCWRNSRCFGYESVFFINLLIIWEACKLWTHQDKKHGAYNKECR